MEEKSINLIFQKELLNSTYVLFQKIIITMKIKLTRNEVYELFLALEAIPKNMQVDIVFATFVTRNIAMLKTDAETALALRQAMQPSDGYQQYLQHIDMVNHKYAMKDNHGNVLLDAHQQPQYAPDIIDMFKQETNDVFKNYKSVINQFDANSAEIKALLNEQKEVEILEIPFSFFPKNLTIDMYTTLSTLIKEDPEVIQNYISNIT